MSADDVATWAERGIGFLVLVIAYKVVPVVWGDFKAMHTQGTGAIDKLSDEISALNESLIVNNIKIETKLDTMHVDIKDNYREKLNAMHTDIKEAKYTTLSISQKLSGRSGDLGGDT